MSTLGLDIGTTGCKALAFDRHGRQLSLAYREYPLSIPLPGRAELDPRQVMESCLVVVGEAAAACGEDRVRAVGVSSQGEAFTPVTARGEVLGHAMVSSDMRAVDQVTQWSEQFGARALYEITGHTPHPMFTLFKLAWLKAHDPATWHGASRFLCFEDLFAQALGLEPCMGYPLAGRTMLFDVRRHEWSPDILAALELAPNRLAKPLPSGAIIGSIPAEMCRSLHLAGDAVLVAGGHDQPCGALGAGVVEPGIAMYASGTVECICPAFRQPVTTAGLFGNNLCTYDFTVGGMYTTVAFSLTGGNLLKWFRDEWSAEDARHARESGKDVYDQILAGMSPAPTSLLSLPYFTPSGTPYFDTITPGAILGLRLSTTRAEVLRALMEGVAMEMRLNLEILDQSGVAVTELRGIGGGARNLQLLQLKADVIDRPITRVAVTEAGCLGMAMLGFAAIEKTDVREVARAWVRPLDAVVPNPRNAGHYKQLFARYKQAYAALSTLARNEQK
jgi:xylulokinase